jgi:hypothetical protein
LVPRLTLGTFSPRVGYLCGETGTCGGSVRSPIPSRFENRHGPWKSIALVGDHALQLGLVGLVRYNASMQFVFSFARLGRKNVPGECMLPDNLPRPGFLEPFRRTFVGL